jgi:hypothetical protein
MRTDPSAHRHPPEVIAMSRRPLLVAALSLATLTLAACSGSSMPTAPQASRLQPTQANHDMCTGGYLDSSGRSC